MPRTVSRHSLAFAALLALAACQQSGDAGAADKPDAKAEATASAGAAATTATAKAESAAGGARSVKTENDLYTFEYSYPAQAGAIEGVRAVLDEDLQARKRELEAMARESHDMAKQEGFPFHGHDLGLGWDVVADLPGWLSLSAGFSTYTGGAHPNHGFDSLLWDKAADKMRDVGELFTSDAALRAAIQPAFCRALDKQRKEKREGYGGGDFGFDECVDPLESTVILGSSNGKTFDRIGVLVAPYVAGPYVEGDYEVTLPVTKDLLAAVRPAYRASFSAGR